jgi:hypothetical protein
MKRFLIMFIVLGLIVASVATANAKKRPARAERSLQGSYNTQFVPFSSLVRHTCTRSGAGGCVTVQTRSRESSLTAKVSDAHGQPVLVTVTGPGSNTQWIEYGTFCGETDQPISFDPGVELAFHIGYWDPYLPTPWADCPPGFGTTGKINVTLTNRS